ncbi:MAG: hypothetical protein JXL80_04840 [Planctomycetes bacterium]|nr:hypothetical protein [Planctomycetota bacterium]
MPVEQQVIYGAINCVLCAFENAPTDRGRFMRLAAVYADDTEEIIWAWADGQGADDTPRPSEPAANHPDYVQLVQTTKCYSADSGTTGEIASRDYALYEFAAPLALNSEKVLKGLQLYDSSPSTSGQARGIAVFAATAGSGYEPPPQCSVALEDDLDWVYQNIPAALARGGHRVRLTVTVLPPHSGDDVTVTLRKKAGSGSGEVTFAAGATNLEKYILGCDRQAPPNQLAGSGDLVIEVVCRHAYWPERIIEVPFTVRPLGDIDGNGGAEPTDISLLINKLNNLDTSGFHPYAFDLDKNGGAEPTDLSVLINVLNALM